jgi:esterase
MAVSLAFRDFGAADPVLILHGLFGSGTNWISVAKRLADRFHVYTLDLRNHGDSPHATSMDYRDMVGDVAAFMDAHGLGACRIVGHSMGGKTAMALALLEPERVERLCVVDIAPVDYAHDYEAILTALSQIDLEAIQGRADVDAALAASLTDPELRSFLLQNLRRRHGVWAWRIDLQAIAAQIDVITGWPWFPPEVMYRGPTLFIAGEHSGHLGPEHEALIHARFPSAVVTRIADAGHWVHAESPRAFQRLLDDFFAQES